MVLLSDAPTAPTSLHIWIAPARCSACQPPATTAPNSPTPLNDSSRMRARASRDPPTTACSSSSASTRVPKPLKLHLIYQLTRTE
jgi:hypothetical protein